MTNPNHNTTTAKCGLAIVPRMDSDKQDRAMKRLPKSVREWLLYDAVADFHLTSVAKHVRTVGAEQALRDMAARQAMTTARVYGADHPQAV
jgi:predicted deacylase